MQKIGLYLHIPFCVKKCNYCDFYSLRKPCGNEIGNYISSLCTHIKRDAHLYNDCEIDTIFIGGGTPSLVDCDDFCRLCDTIKDSFCLPSDLEFTIEANPDTITRDRLMTWKKCGVNRLSIGMQSACDSELLALGRVHSLDTFDKGFKLARECGFDNISVDIMYALPDQNPQKLQKTLDYVLNLASEHISTYCLKIENGTPFSKMDLSLPNEDEQYEMYLSICEQLSSHGYEQYEISNFAKNGMRSKHNMKYWLSHEYIGFGPSAHSFFDRKRYFYAPSVEKYTHSLENGELPEKLYESDDILSNDEKMDEYVMLRLRLCDGACADDFEARFGKSLTDLYDFDKYIKSGHMRKAGNSYSFTTKGFFVSNFILSDILKNI